MRDNRALVRGYFEHVYRREDPYEIAENPEEEAKREATMAAIADRRYAAALEIGGGEGLLARRLADQVDDLLMVDLSERALQRARGRLEDKPNVRIERLDVVAQPLPGRFELIVCSEVLVYVQPGDLDAVKAKVLAALAEGGDLLLVHSRSIHDDDSGLEYKDIGAKTVHQPFIDDPRTRVVLDESEPMYRITVMRRVGG
jgi:ubiquinone/menaquinone biosynthesis C-methylase UbiE